MKDKLPMKDRQKKQRPTLLYGKNSVLERLRKQPKTILRVLIQTSFVHPEIMQLIALHHIPCSVKSEAELQRNTRADRLQGIVAEVEPFAYTPLEELLTKRPSLSIIMLDGVNDPHNLGVILRLAACSGGYAICIPSRESCEINNTVLHVASGGENFVPVIKSDSLQETLKTIKAAGYLCIATSVDHGINPRELKASFPICLILGAEGRGLRKELIAAADAAVTIPMPGAQLSLNVAMACSMLLYEFMQQKTTG